MAAKSFVVEKAYAGQPSWSRGSPPADRRPAPTPSPTAPNALRRSLPLSPSTPVSPSTRASRSTAPSRSTRRSPIPNSRSTGRRPRHLPRSGHRLAGTSGRGPAHARDGAGWGAPGATDAPPATPAPEAAAASRAGRDAARHPGRHPSDRGTRDRRAAGRDAGTRAGRDCARTGARIRPSRSGTRPATPTSSGTPTASAGCSTTTPPSSGTPSADHGGSQERSRTLTDLRRRSRWCSSARVARWSISWVALDCGSLQRGGRAARRGCAAAGRPPRA